MRHDRRASLFVLMVPLVVGCAADLPADDRLAMVADSLQEVEAAAEQPPAPSPEELERERIEACVDALHAQFVDPADSLAGDSAAGKTDAVPDSVRRALQARRWPTGEDPERAKRYGWPVVEPLPAPGAVLPCERIVAYYGNPLSRRMGVLGEYDPEEMLARLDRAVAEWEAADPRVPVRPALHLVTLVAQADPGRNGLYRLWMTDSLVETVYGWAQSRDALLFLDLQVGLSTVQAELPRLARFLQRPDVHVGLDPEFAMKGGAEPGHRIGSMDAAEINWAIDFLADIVNDHGLPPKVLVVHRFTRGMLTNASEIRLRPEVQVVIDMDGWGQARLKRSTYHSFIVPEPVQFTGFKIFYHNDVREPGWTLMTPEEVLRLRPQPLYIQYQ